MATPTDIEQLSNVEMEMVSRLRASIITWIRNGETITVAI